MLKPMADERRDSPHQPPDATPPLKVLGRRRTEGRVTVDEAFALQDTIALLHPGGICERGVFRFHSFEEAQTWLLKQMTRRARARRRERTSSSSPAVSTPSEPATR